LVGADPVNSRFAATGWLRRLLISQRKADPAREHGGDGALCADGLSYSELPGRTPGEIDVNPRFSGFLNAGFDWITTKQNSVKIRWAAS